MKMQAWAFGVLGWSVAGWLTCDAAHARVSCETLFPSAGAFSIVVKETVTQERTDAEGRIAAGGNATFANCSVGTKAKDSGVDYDYSILVGGNFDLESGSVWSGAVGVGGTASYRAASFSNGVRRVNPKPVLDVFQAEITAASLVVGTFAKSGTVRLEKERLDLVSTAEDLAVFDVTAAQLGTAREMFVDVPEGASMLIRVADEAVALNRLAFYYRGAAPERTLFHFPKATLVEIDRVSMEGSLLAPNAAVRFRNGEMNGNLYAKSLSGNGRVNQVKFAACLRP